MQLKEKKSLYFESPVGEYYTSPFFFFSCLKPCIEKSAYGNFFAYAFVEKELDDGIELSYFGARYYDADIGLWISPDNARQFHSLYSYTGNGYNPINSIDPDGNAVFAAEFGLSFGVQDPVLTGTNYVGVSAGRYLSWDPLNPSANMNDATYFSVETGKQQLGVTAGADISLQFFPFANESDFVGESKVTNIGLFFFSIQIIETESGRTGIGLSTGPGVDVGVSQAKAWTDNVAGPSKAEQYRVDDLE